MNLSERDEYLILRVYIYMYNSYENIKGEHIREDRERKREERQG